MLLFPRAVERREKSEKNIFHPKRQTHTKKKNKKNRGRQREGYGEKRSSVFYDRGACCSTAFKMLLTGSRWEEETQSGAPRPGYTQRTGAQRHADQRTKGFCCLRTLLCSVTWPCHSSVALLNQYFYLIIITWLLSKLPPRLRLATIRRCAKLDVGFGSLDWRDLIRSEVLFPQLLVGSPDSTRCLFSHFVFVASLPHSSSYSIWHPMGD